MIRLHFRKDLLLDVWPGFFGVLALWWELSGAGEVAALAMLGAVLLHECGHLFCYWRTGISEFHPLFRRDDFVKKQLGFTGK